MQNKYKILGIIGIVIVLLLVIGGIINLLKSSEVTSKDNVSRIISESEESSYGKIPTLILNFDNVQVNPPAFKTGERYVYSVWILEKTDPDSDLIILPLNYTGYIKIKGAERFNTTNWYNIVEENTPEYSHALTKENGNWRPVTSTEPIEFGGCDIKVNAENCKLSFTSFVNKRCPLLEDMVIHWEYYLPCYLNETTKYILEGIRGDKRSILDFEVTKKEKIKNIVCFKLEVKQKHVINNIERIDQKSVYWIDVEKRIPLKVQKYEGTILVEEINLQEIIEK